LVSNILVHREFSGGFGAQIIVEKDRIRTENWNRSVKPGRLDPNNYQPYPKNPILARFFLQIGYADILGSGVKNLYKYSKIFSGGEPVLIDGDFFKTIVPLGLTVSLSVTDNVTENGTDNVTENVTDKVTERITEKESEVLVLISQNKSVTQEEMAKKLGVSRKTISVRLKSLKDKELIRRVGSAKKGRWEIKVTDEVTDMLAEKES
jgi:ATP-dependent DNA helicase RecG